MRWAARLLSGLKARHQWRSSSSSSSSSIGGGAVPTEFDTVVRGGRVFLDGEQRLVRTDIGIAAGRIAAMGPGLHGRQVVDATGTCVPSPSRILLPSGVWSRMAFPIAFSRHSVLAVYHSHSLGGGSSQVRPPRRRRLPLPHRAAHEHGARGMPLDVCHWTAEQNADSFYGVSSVSREQQ